MTVRTIVAHEEEKRKLGLTPEPKRCVTRQLDETIPAQGIHTTDTEMKEPPYRSRDNLSIKKQVSL